METETMDYTKELVSSFERGQQQRKAKKPILTVESFKALFNNVLPHDLIVDKYRAYRNGYISG